MTRSWYDSSLWHSRQEDDPEAIKNLSRDGVEHASAVCVLIGPSTWSSRWVRYEIARAVIARRGLLAVHLNDIRYDIRGQAKPRDRKPLALLAVGKLSAKWGEISPSETPPYELFERKGRSVGNWIHYPDHAGLVSLPPYLPDPCPDYMTRLSDGRVAVYDL